MQYFGYTRFLSYKKITNYVKLKYSYFLKRNNLKNQVRVQPFSIAIEPTNICNLKCPECPTGNQQLSRDSGMMSFDTFKNIVDSLKGTLINITLHFQGEPLLNKDIYRFIDYADKNNIFTTLSTNAQLLKTSYKKLAKAGLKRLIISLDGLSQQTYNLYRKEADINKVFEALEHIAIEKINNKPQIELQFLVFSHNEHEIPNLKKIKTKYKIDKVAIKTAQISNNPNLAPQNPKYSRYKKADNQLVIKSRSKNACFRMFSSAVITWDGNVVPCCFDKDANYTMGNINKTHFNDIWNSKKYNNFRNQIFTNRKAVGMCNNCTENIKECIRYI